MRVALVHHDRDRCHVLFERLWHLNVHVLAQVNDVTRLGEQPGHVLTEMVLVVADFPGAQTLNLRELTRTPDGRTVPVLVLIASPLDERSVLNGLSVRGNGYCSEDAEGVRLVQALLALSNDWLWLDAPIAAILSRRLAALLEEEADLTLENWSRSVLASLAEGKSYTQAAGDARITTGTVKTALRYALQRLRIPAGEQ